MAVTKAGCVGSSVPSLLAAGTWIVRASRKIVQCSREIRIALLVPIISVGGSCSNYGAFESKVGTGFLGPRIEDTAHFPETGMCSFSLEYINAERTRFAVATIKGSAVATIQGTSLDGNAPPAVGADHHYCTPPERYLSGVICPRNTIARQFSTKEFRPSTEMYRAYDLYDCAG